MVIGKRNIETARASFHVLSYLPYQINKLTLIHQNKHNKKYSMSKEKNTMSKSTIAAKICMILQNKGNLKSSHKIHAWRTK